MKKPDVIKAVDYTAPKLDVYIQSAKVVQQYAAWIESQEIPSGVSGESFYGQAVNVLNHLKTTNNSWLGIIYPEYLQMPNLIASKSKSIDDNVNLLIQLVKQLEANPNNKAIEKSIIQYTSNLSDIVKGLYKSISTLGNQLGQFHQELSVDYQTVQAMPPVINSGIQQNRQMIYSLQAKIHHMESDHCPNRQAIASLEQELVRYEQMVSAAYQTGNLFSQILTNTEHEISALTYFSNYWETVSQEASRTVLIMKRINAEVGSILDLDLKEMFANWQLLILYYKELYQEIQKLKLIK